jgi:hypothetical protein
MNKWKDPAWYNGDWVSRSKDYVFTQFYAVEVYCREKKSQQPIDLDMSTPTSKPTQK